VVGGVVVVVAVVKRGVVTVVVVSTVVAVACLKASAAFHFSYGDSLAVCAVVAVVAGMSVVEVVVGVVSVVKGGIVAVVVVKEGVVVADAPNTSVAAGCSDAGRGRVALLLNASKSNGRPYSVAPDEPVEGKAAPGCVTEFSLGQRAGEKAKEGALDKSSLSLSLSTVDGRARWGKL
jgi:hypothetical protein